MLLQGIKLMLSSIIDDYAPASRWFEYSLIETSQYAYPAGQDEIIVYSYNKWKKKVNAEWNDTLQCLRVNTWVDVGGQSMRKVKGISDNSLHPFIWTLRVPLPDEEALCRVESSIIIHLPNTTKSKTIQSNDFMVIE